ncbi:cell surface glycoprotein 1-like [Amphibalanus amphitrite]|uniref:cell surface glycoprotein 1-like n=1 Tax=Amphibalanus amphitrite TaxID=1232801 RepID=UPI001C9263CE|nr:cell surface glycoprotein 1-like [Amphibalanus amphitrite]
MKHSTGLLLLLCTAALVSSLPTSLHGGEEALERHEEQPVQPTGEYQRQQLYDQQAKDQDRLLNDRQQLMHDQEEQTEDQQKQLSWQNQLTEQQQKDQQQLLKNQQQFLRDQQRNQNEQILQLRQRQEEKVLLDKQEEILRLQSQQQQARASEEHNIPNADGSAKESLEAGADELVSTPVTLISESAAPEPVVVGTVEEEPSSSDPSLPSIENLLIYGDSAEQATDGAVHDSNDIRAGSASVRKIVIANALSDSGLEGQTAKLAGSSTGLKTPEQNEEESLTTGEEPRNLAEEDAPGSEAEASRDVLPLDNEMELNDAITGAEKKAVPELKQEQPFVENSPDTAEPEASSVEDSPDHPVDETEIDGTKMMQAPAQPSQWNPVQCVSGSVCLKKTDNCDMVTSPSGENCVTAGGALGVCCGSAGDRSASESAQTGPPQTPAGQTAPGPGSAVSSEPISSPGSPDEAKQTDSNGSSFMSEPAPAPEPIPSPEPTPSPARNPSPEPIPSPEPAPSPKPTPSSEQTPKSTPTPKAEQVSSAESAARPEPAPGPEPIPSPEPTPSLESTVGSQPSPSKASIQKLDPIPQPKPTATGLKTETSTPVATTVETEPETIKTQPPTESLEQSLLSPSHRGLLLPQPR